MILISSKPLLTILAEVIMRHMLPLLILALLLAMASSSSADVISNIRFTPGPMCAVPFGQNVTITFDYAITTPGGVRIFPRPFSKGALTPNYAASPSGLFTGTGTGTGYFSITSGDIIVDHVRFQIYNADQSLLVLEFFVPVMFKYATHGIYNIQFTPTTPGSIKFNSHMNITFDYTTAQAGGVRIYCEPYLGGSYAPNGAYQPSPLYATGSGTGASYVTVLSGATPVDAILFSMWKGDNSAEILRFIVPVDYYFSGTSIQTITYSPLGPNGLLFGEKLNASFSYSTDEATGVRIFVRPYTHGALTPNYGAHASPTYPTGNGSGTGWFTISSQEVTVDSLVFLVYDGATGNNLLLSYFVPTNIHFAAHKVTDIQFNPTPPAYFTTSHYDSMQFTYTHSYSGGAYLWALPYEAGDICDYYAYTGSTLLPTGTGALNRRYTITSGNHIVDCTRFLMRNQSQTETVMTWDVPVQFYFGNQSLVGVSELAAKPEAFVLEQNYPNPFNPTTNLRFSIANPQLTILKVYDLLGREVATLVNDVKQPGTYTVQFNGSGLASGVYLYRIQAGNFTQTKRLLLLK